MLIGSMFEQLACYIHLFVFFLSQKTPFLQARRLLNRSSTYFLLSSPSFSFSRKILMDSQSIKLFGFLLDSFFDPSRHFSKLSIRQILDKFSIHQGDFAIDNTLTDSFLLRFSARQISTDISIHRVAISLYRLGTNQILFFTSLSLDRISFLSPQTLFFHSNLLTVSYFGLDQALILW